MTESELIERLRIRVIPDPLLGLMQLDPLCQQAALTIERLRTHPPEYARLIEAAAEVLQKYRRITPQDTVVSSTHLDNLAAALAAIKGNPNAQG